MSASGGSNSGAVGSEKAHFINDDTHGLFFVQFNPKEFKLDEAAAWKDSKEFHADKPLIEFDRGKPSGLSMDLIFDTTDSGSDVRTNWTAKLAGFLAVTVEDKTNTKEGIRPPTCTFKWGSFNFEGVIESLSTTFLMFSTDGTPLRAKVSVKMKERSEDLGSGTSRAGVVLSAPVSMFSGGGNRSNSRTEAPRISAKTVAGSAAVKQEQIGVGSNTTQQASGFTGVSTYVVQEGDTLSGIALSLSIEFWWIAAANNIDDPMNLCPGDTLVIPPSEQIADVFQHMPSGGNYNWGDYDPQLNEDSDLADIFSIYDGSWDPFAEQELEDLGMETGLEQGSAGGQLDTSWAMSSYEGEAPDASTFEHGESGSADIFSIYSGGGDDDDDDTPESSDEGFGGRPDGPKKRIE